MMNEHMEQQADDVLVAQAQNGEVDAFMELARRLQEKVQAVIFGMTRNREDAGDLTQETFMVAYRSLGSFRGNSSFYTWIYRIAVNRTLNFLKKRGREKGREDYEDNRTFLENAEVASRSPEGEAVKTELRANLEEAIDGLGAPYRAAFNLVAVQGMSHGQAAAVLGCSENTVSWRMHKARKMLQVRLKPYLEEAGNAT
jgi:RNA polymerase sigma-70 factor (ECF subfamily)